MLTITHNNQTELINNHRGLELTKEVDGGALQLTFASFSMSNNPGHDLIKEETVVNAYGYDLRIKQLRESHSGKVKEVTAFSTFFDLAGETQDTIYGGTRTLDQFATFTFNGTGWTFENIDVNHSALIPNFGENNIVALVNLLCEAFECEFEIMPDRHIRFAKEIGPDRDAQYRHGHNFKALNRSVDTMNLKTQIVGIGGNGLKVTYTSPNHTVYGIKKVIDPYVNEEITTLESMNKALAKELNDEPEVSIQLDAVDLHEKELGERVWLIYSEKKGQVVIKTRVMAKTYCIRNGVLSTKSVTLGNTKRKGMSDILASIKVEFDKNKKETRSRIEQTNEKIELEVERLDGEIVEAYSFINLTADNIRQEVGNVKGDVAALDIKATNIELSVSSLGGRLGNAESQLSVQAGQISSKVSQTDYNGNTLISMINQTAETVTINASKINLSGLTEVADTLYIGGHFTDQSVKSIIFRGVGGGVSITSPGYTDSMVIEALNEVEFSTGVVSFRNYSTINIGTGTTVNGLYARFG